MTDQLLVTLTIHLAQKKTLIGPELHTYMEGLAYCEKVLRLANQALDEVIDDYPGENEGENTKSKSRLSND